MNRKKQSKERLRKRSYRLSEFASDLLGLAPHLPALARGAAAYAKPGGEVGRLLQEEIFTAVARRNQCRYCIYIHEGFAQFAGASDAELAAIEGSDPGRFDRGRWLAVQYALAWLEGSIPEELGREFAATYSPAAQAEIRAAAASMNFTSLCGNTVDSFLARVASGPGARRDGRAWEELLVTLLAAPVGGPALAASALLRGARRMGLASRSGPTPYQIGRDQEI